MRRGVVLLALGASGCSMLTMQAPPPLGPAHQLEARCTESSNMPLVSFLLSGASFGGAVAVAALRPEHEELELIGLGALGVAFLVDGILGVTWASRCRELHEPPPGQPPIRVLPMPGDVK